MSNNQQSDPFVNAAKIMGDAIATATQTATAVSEAVETVGKTAFRTAHPLIEQATEGTGRTLSSVSQNPVVKFLTDRLGASWLKVLFGEVDRQEAMKAIALLQRQHPQESPSQIAHRLIVEKSLSAGGLGLATNIIPPVAIALLGLEVAAVSKMQAEMIYQIAAAYGLDLEDHNRRGEVLAALGLGLGSSGVFKGGLGIIELLPVIGALYGATTNAATLYTLGNAASRYYEAKTSSVSSQ